MRFFTWIILFSSLFSNFDSSVLSKTYNISTASLSNPKDNEIFSLQSGYDYNKYNMGILQSPKTTEVSFWYYFPFNIELGLQYDGTRLYHTDSSNLLYKANSGIVSIYYHLKDSPKFPFDIKIGGLYGELDVEGVDLTENNITDYKEKTTGYGFALYKTLLSLNNNPVSIGERNFIDIILYTSTHIMFNTNNTIKEDILYRAKNTYLKNSYGIILSFKYIQFTPYISYNDGDWINGWSVSLLFNKL